MAKDMLHACAEFLAAANCDPDRSLERVLCRNVTDSLFAVQMWFFNEQEPESVFVEFGEHLEQLRPTTGPAKPPPGPEEI